MAVRIRRVFSYHPIVLSRFRLLHLSRRQDDWHFTPHSVPSFLGHPSPSLLSPSLLSPSLSTFPSQPPSSFIVSTLPHLMACRTYFFVVARSPGTCSNLFPLSHPLSSTLCLQTHYQAYTPHAIDLAVPVGQLMYHWTHRPTTQLCGPVTVDQGQPLLRASHSGPANVYSVLRISC